MRYWTKQGPSGVLDFQLLQTDEARWLFEQEATAHLDLNVSWPKRDHLLLETQAFIRAAQGDKQAPVCLAESVLPSLSWRDQILQLLEAPRS